LVIYLRYSSDMQRADSCADQERNIRAALDRLGIDHQNALVLRDEGESGTKLSRDGFARLHQLVYGGQVRLLAVDDQSRLSRADNAFAFIQDLVYHDGRFLSTGEGIDTAQRGWELRVKVMELHHSTTIRELGHRVRRGQEGRVRDDGSAGDFPFGYESYFLDPDEALRASRRGPKPKKGLRLCEDEARWVRQVFDWFVDGVSLAEIARRLTRADTPKDHRSSKPGWYHQQVARMLANPKYVGVWAWGGTTTIRDSSGRKKQVPTRPEERVECRRPDLRLVTAEVWEKAQRRLAELKARFGAKPGQKKRGPKAHPSAVYPQSLLGGLLVCGVCGAGLWQLHSNQRRYYACPNHKKGSCSATAQVQAETAEQALIDYLTNLLCGWPEWLADLRRRVHDLLSRQAEAAPAALSLERQRLAELGRQIDNLVNALAEGRLNSAAVGAKLTQLEAEREEGRRRADALETAAADVSLPAEEWLSQQLCVWAEGLKVDETRKVAQALRQAVTEVRAEAVVAPGKKRGFVRLRFRVRGWDLLRTVAGACAAWPPLVEGDAASAEAGLSPEVTLDLGQPTPMDWWASLIVAWRTEGVPWAEIVRRTGLDLNRVFIAWKRHRGTAGQDSDLA
jgi:DNA invertase Pin-like site-specific DNA recombinase